MTLALTAPIAVDPTNVNTDGPHKNTTFFAKAVRSAYNSMAIQTIAWNSSTNHLFIAQSDSSSNLYITRYTSTGTVQSTNIVLAADHGEQIGIEPQTGGSNVWVGCRADGAGRAQDIGYFQFDNSTDGRQFLQSDLTVWTSPVANAGHFTPYVDAVNGYLQLRYLPSGGSYRLGVFSLADVKAYMASGGTAPAMLADYAVEDPIVADGNQHDMAGHCMNGRYSYTCWWSEGTTKIAVARHNYNDGAHQYSGLLSLNTGYSHVETEGASMYFDSTGAQHFYFGINNGDTNHTFDLYYYN